MTINSIVRNQRRVDREIRREQGRRDPLEHETFPTYNEQFYAKGGVDDWITVNQEDWESEYQTIRFLSHRTTATGILYVLSWMENHRLVHTFPRITMTP